MKAPYKKRREGFLAYSIMLLALLFLFPSCKDAFDVAKPTEKSNKNQTKEQTKAKIELLETDDGFKYAASERSIAIYGLSDETDRVNLIIPAEIDGMPVTEIAEKAFYNEDSIHSVQFPETLEIIGKNAFTGCDNLISIELPKNVKSIEAAFGGCDSLETVILNEGIQNINSAFGSAQIEEITIPGSVTSMEYAFDDCMKLKTVTLSEGITTIDEHEFYNCINLTTIELPQTITEIGESAFRQSGLEQIEFPDSLKTIRECAFGGTKLTSVVLPNDIEIVEDAFPPLKTINIPTSWESIDNDFFSGVEELYIPANIKKINCRVGGPTKKLTIACDIPEDFYDFTVDNTGAPSDSNRDTPICVYGEKIDVVKEETETWTDDDGTEHEETYTRTDSYRKGIELIIEDNVKIISGKILSGNFSSIKLGKNVKLQDFNIREKGLYHSWTNDQNTYPDSLIVDSANQAFENCNIQVGKMQFDVDVPVTNCEFKTNNIVINTDLTQMQRTLFKGDVKDAENGHYEYDDEGNSVYIESDNPYRKARLIVSDDDAKAELVIADGVTLLPAKFDGFHFIKAQIPDSVITRTIETAFYRCIFDCDFDFGQYFLTPEYRIAPCVYRCIIFNDLKIPEGWPAYRLFDYSDLQNLEVPYLTAGEEMMFLQNEPKNYDEAPDWNYAGMITNCSMEEVNFTNTLPRHLFTRVLLYFGETVISTGCSIKKIVLSPEITQIEKYMFIGITGLKEIDLSNVTYIGDYAFSNCTDLEKVIFGSNPTIVNPYSFNECVNAEFIFNGPIVMDSMAEKCFYGCKKLTSLPQIKGDIAEYAFAATGITEFVVPLNNFSGSAFEECNFTSITVPEGSTAELKDGILYVDYYEEESTYDDEKEDYIYQNVLQGKKALICIRNVLPENIVMDEDVKMIDYGCFRDCDNIKTVTAPGLIIVNERAFYNCTNLQSVKVYGTVRKTHNDEENKDYYSYSGCNYYTSAFEGCKKLEYIYDSDNRINCFGCSTWMIGEKAFKDCSSLKEITVAYNRMEIGKNTFAGCSSLETIHSYICEYNISFADNAMGKERFKDSPLLNKVYCYYYFAHDGYYSGIWGGDWGSLGRAKFTNWFTGLNNITEYVKISEEDFKNCTGAIQ